MPGVQAQPLLLLTLATFALATAATSRQPSSVGDFPQVAHAKFQRSIAVERIYQLSATIEKRSDHHWRIFR